MGPGSAEVSGDPSADVEVTIGGKTYPSVRAYKLAWLKEYLRKELPSGVLGQFEPQEICDVIRQIKQQQTQVEASAGLQNQPLDNSRGVAEDVREMEEMLRDYQDEHQDAHRLPAIDPARMKTIIIDPPADSPKK